MESTKIERQGDKTETTVDQKDQKKGGSIDNIESLQHQGIVGENEKLEDSMSFLKGIFDTNESVQNKLGGIIQKLTLFPYYVFSWFIYLTGITLIPKSFIMLLGKIGLPVLFSLTIISIFLLSGTHVALPSIDNALFGVNFFPLMGWITGSIFLILFISGYAKILHQYQDVGLGYSLFKSKGFFVFLGILIITTFLLPLLSTFSKGFQSINFDNIYVVLSNGFGYLIYFVYIYLIINILMMLYKKIIYVIFSILNKETLKIGGHILSIALYILVIVLINQFLEISLISIT